MAVLSGPPAVLGGQLRDGFLLGSRTPAASSAGRDDSDRAGRRAEARRGGRQGQALIERDKVDFVVGPIFSNILMAIHKPITEAGAFLISPNAGPSTLAGKGCSPYFFATSYQNDQNHEVLGKYAQDKGLQEGLPLAPNYQAGKDALAGFKRTSRARSWTRSTCR